MDLNGVEAGMGSGRPVRRLFWHQYRQVRENGSQEEGKRHVRNMKEVKSAGLWEEKGRNQLTPR